MLRAIPLLSALALLLSSPSQAALVSKAPASLPPAVSENASTAFLNDGSESQIGLLCHNDPVNKSDPTGLYIEFTEGKKEFWDSWKKQFESRWKDSGFRDWYNKAASSKDGYVAGPKGTTGSGGIKAEVTLPHTMPRASDGSSAVQRAQTVKDSHQDQGTNMTHYGYPGDPTPDRNSRLGLGSNNNILNPDSVSLSPDKANGLSFGGPVNVNGHFIGFYHDSTANNLTNRVDVYDPSNAFH